MKKNRRQSSFFGRKRKAGTRRSRGSNDRGLRRVLLAEPLESRVLLAADAFAPFHNADNPFDVTGDRLVTAHDAGWLAMDLLRNGSRSLGVSSLTGSSTDGPHAEGEGHTQGFVDVNGDNFVTPLDMAILSQSFAEGAGPQVAFFVELTDSGGATPSDLTVGQTYTVTILTEDLRNPSDPDFPDLQGDPANLGIFAAYTDVTFDESLTIVGGFDHGDDGDPSTPYTELTAGGGSNPFPTVSAGRVEDLGGVQDGFGLDGPVGPGQFFVVSFQVELTSAGLVAVDDAANVDENSTEFINVLSNDSIDDEVSIDTERANGVGKEVLTLLADSGDINSQNVPESDIQRPGLTLDIEGASLQDLQIVSDPSNGTATVVTVNNETGISYTPDSGFTGQDTLTYQVSDGVGGTATATVTISVGPINDPPVNAVPSSVTVNEDTTFAFTGSNSISVSDPDAGSGEVDVSLTVQEGTLAIGSPSGGVQVSGQNQANLTLTGNLTDLNDSLASLTYTPAQDFNGTDELVVNSNDNGNTGDGGPQEDTDTVTINVSAVNDAPVNNVPPDQFVDEETDLVFNSTNANLISITDVDAGSGNITTTISVDTGTVTLGSTSNVTVTGDGSGSVTLQGTLTSVNNALNGLTYTPPLGFIGSVELTIDTSDNGNTGSGPVGTDADSIDIEVEPTVRPRARNDAFTVAEDDLGTEFDVTANDIPNEGSDVTLESFTQPANGTVTLNDQGTTEKTDDTLSFIPDDDFFGTTTFTYVIDDTSSVDHGLSEAERTATVTVTVTEVNDAPTAVDDSASTDEDTPLNLSTAELTGNDSKGPANESSQTLTIIAVGNASNGSVTLNGGTVTYTPALDFNGTDTFTYTIQDNGTTNGADDFKTSQASVTVTVNPVNDDPVPIDDTNTTPEDEELSFAASNLADNDGPGGGADEANQNLTVTAVSSVSAEGGTVTLSGGTVTYTPLADFNGTDTFTYTVTDDGTPNASATGTVSITVTPVNDAPIAQDDSDIGIKDFTTTYNALELLLNDSPGPANESSQSLTVTAVASASSQGGTVSFNSATGVITYTPPAEFTGEDRITYTVTDNGQTNGVDDFMSSEADLVLDVLDFVPSEISGTVFFDADGNGQMDPGEGVISGTEITLTGEDFQGQQVSLTTQTNAAGFYEFTNLAPGDYTVRQEQPAFTLDGHDSQGSQGGTSANDEFSFSIGILGNVFGTGNNFGETSLEPSLFSVQDLIASQQMADGVLIALDGSGNLEWFTALGGWEGADRVTASLSGSSTLDITVTVNGSDQTRSVSLGSGARLLGNDSLDGEVIRLQGTAADFGFTLADNNHASPQAEGEALEAPEMQDVELLAHARHGTDGAFAESVDKVFAQMS